MRTLVVTEDLVDAAWNFTLKSTRVGHVPAEAAKAKARERATRLGFRQKLNITIPVCVGIFFSTLLLLFVLWAVEDSELRFARGDGWILEKGNPGSIPRRWRIQERVNVGEVHGMGVAFGQGNMGGRRRRRSMSELIVAHMTERVTNAELGMFVRTLYRSGALARADLVILFPANSFTENASNVIQQECDLGRKKLDYCFHSPGACNNSASNSLSVFNAAAFKEAADEIKERKRGDPGGIVVGSVTAFEMEELDAANILQDFVDDPPAQLRRWVCYQLLLGFLRHKYTTVLLARIGGVVILGDALAAARKSKANAGSLLLLAEPRSWDLAAAATAAQNRRCRKHRTAQKAHTKSLAPLSRRKKSLTVVEAVYGAEVWRSLSGDVKRRRLISSGVIAGTTGAVRALANAMVNEIVRVSVVEHPHLHLCGEALPDHVLLSYLVHVSSVLGRKLTDNLQLVDNSCQLSFAYSVAGANRTLTELLSTADVRHSAVDGLSENGKSASFAEMIRQDLCDSPNDGNLYPDCLL